MSPKIEYLFVLFTVSILTSSCSSMNSMNGSNSSVYVENVSFTQISGKVHVSYDLISNRGNQPYEVYLVLFTHENERYEINPTSLSGDVGHGIEAGEQKTIIWDALHDFPQGLRNDQIQFGINVMQDTDRSSRDWVYITAGVVALGAGFSAMILMDNRGSGRSSRLPLPPSRPGF